MSLYCESLNKILLEASELNHKRLLHLGWDCSPSSVIHHKANLYIEPPVRTSSSRLTGKCSIGAFSYTVDGLLSTTDMGRYCSIAKSINIGQTNHPMTLLSMNPTFFIESFRIKTGAEFPFHEEYMRYCPSPIAIKAAHEEVARRTFIGNDVWIGFGAVVVAGVRIGDGAVVGANSVVTKDVDPYTIVAGAPARPIRKRFSEDLISRLLELRWWDYAPWQLKDLDVTNISSSLEILSQMRLNQVSVYKPSVLVTQ